MSHLLLSSFSFIFDFNTRDRNKTFAIQSNNNKTHIDITLLKHSSILECISKNTYIKRNIKRNFEQCLKHSYFKSLVNSSFNLCALWFIKFLIYIWKCFKSYNHGSIVLSFLSLWLQIVRTFLDVIFWYFLTKSYFIEFLSFTAEFSSKSNSW